MIDQCDGQEDLKSSLKAARNPSQVLNNMLFTLVHFVAREKCDNKKSMRKQHNTKTQKKTKAVDKMLRSAKSLAPWLTEI